MRNLRFLAVMSLAGGLLLMCGPASAEGLIAGTYALTYSEDVQKKTDYVNKRNFQQTLDTKYTGFLSPIITNEITLKVLYVKASDTETKISFYPTITLTYKGSYWDAGSKRTITREPDTNQKVTDSHFVELFYQPFRYGLPDLKGKYTADFDVQSGATDMFKQAVTLSSAYQPVEWFNLKGDYSWSSSTERFKKDPNDKTLTPVAKEEKYSFTAGIRHFVSDKLKFNSEWKSEFSRAATFFDNGVAKGDSIREDQTHTLKNTLAFRPFDATSIDASYDYDLKETMVPKSDPVQGAQQEHTLTYNAAARIAQKIGTPLEVRGEFTRTKTDVRHSLLPGINVDDGWNLETKGDFGKLVQVDVKYAQHNILADNPGAPNIIPKRTGSIARSASWTGDLLPVWKPAVTYDKTDTYDDVVARGRYVKSVDTKYGLRGPLDFKQIDLTIDPTYDIVVKHDYTNIDPAQQEAISTRDLKVKVSKLLLVTRTIEVKVDHTYGRKTETGHLDSGLNNLMRTDTSNANVTVKDILPNFLGGFDFTRSATDTSGDADGPDVTENFAVKIDYKYETFGWNASYKYDRNLRFDKSNKWTIDWKATWTARSWIASLTYNQSKALSVLLDESYKVGVDLTYNF